jgi:hypothetical protein
MRYLLLTSSMLLASLSAFSAVADENDLSNGVFIAHYVPELQYSEPAAVCDDYTTYAISTAEEQVNRIDVSGDSLSATWYVLSAWCEDKAFCRVQFGLGDYDNTTGFVMMRYEPCCPSMYIQIPSSNWPEPNSGTVFRPVGAHWVGNYVPVYYFSGYAYTGETVIPLGQDQTAAVPFGGWGSCEPPWDDFEAAAFGGMGINTDGVYAEPPAPSAVGITTWGGIRAMYRE